MTNKNGNTPKPNNQVNRRDFLFALASCTAGLMLPNITHAQGANLGALAGTLTGGTDRLGALLPQRKLGTTGAVVTNLGLGGGHITGVPEATAQAMIEKALEEGVRFFDTAVLYGNGISESRYGKHLTPKYRDVSFIMTKTLARDGDSARRDLDASLKRLNVESIDLWQLHALDTPEDVERRIQNGVLDAFQTAQESGKVKHLGFTGHTSYKAHLKMLQEAEKRGLKFAAAQMPINPADPHFDSFVINVLPKCVNAGVGVLAMKTVADGRFWGGNAGWKRTNVNVQPAIPNALSLAQVFAYVWSLPVSCLISGMETVAHVTENAAMARNQQTLNEEKRQQLVDAMAPYAGQDLEFYKN